MEQIVLIIQVISALCLIILVLLQQGKGAEMGASFGSGASQTIFGSQGSASFITRSTAIMAIVFFLSTLGLGYLATHRAQPEALESLLEKVEQNKKTTGSNNLKEDQGASKSTGEPSAREQSTGKPSTDEQKAPTEQQDVSDIPAIPNPK